MNQPLAQGRHSSQQDERETNLVQMNVKPCYCSSWLMRFGHSRASAFSLLSRSYFVHALAQMVRIEMLQWAANKKNKPPLALENGKSRRSPLGAVCRSQFASEGHFCVWSWWVAKFSITRSFASLGNCICFSVVNTSTSCHICNAEADNPYQAS